MSDPTPEPATSTRTGGQTLILVGLVLALLAAVLTVGLWSDLSDANYDGTSSSVAWSTFLSGLTPIGIGLLIAAVGLVVTRLDDR